MYRIEKKKSSDLENRSTEIIQTGTHTNTHWLKKEREKNPSINCRTVSEGLSLCVIKIAKKKREREREERIFKEILAKSFSNQLKTTNTNQENSKNPHQINTKYTNSHKI